MHAVLYGEPVKVLKDECYVFSGAGVGEQPGSSEHIVQNSAARVGRTYKGT